jgi:hypothetical protein
MGMNIHAAGDAALSYDQLAGADTARCVKPIWKSCGGAQLAAVGQRRGTFSEERDSLTPYGVQGGKEIWLSD